MGGIGGDDEDGQVWGTGNEVPLESAQLALDDEGERLPWLESADDDYADFESGEAPRMIGFIIMGLLALAVLGGGIWWYLHRGPDPALVADGSTIPAPPGPYKQAPSDPGGKTFAGTGDTSFAVSEGQNRPAQLGGSEAPVASPPLPSSPSPTPTKASTPAPVAKPTATPAKPGIGVQVGAYSSQSSAEAGWTRLVAQANGLLDGVSHRVVAGSADIGTVYRLQAVAGDQAGASALCAKLKAQRIACQVK